MGAGKYDNKHEVGIMLNKRWRKRIIDTECINERAITATILVNRQQIKMMSVYFPYSPCPVVCNDRCRGVQSAENCESPVVAVQFDMAVDVLVMQVCSLSSSTRSSPSLSSTSSLAVMAVERGFFRLEIRHFSRSVSAH